jgi:hypothetical protein
LGELFAITVASASEAQVIANQAAVPATLPAERVIPGERVCPDTELGGKNGDAVHAWNLAALGKTALSLYEFELEGTSQASWIHHPCQ